jgi:hypothetical protein
VSELLLLVGFQGYNLVLVEIIGSVRIAAAGWFPRVQPFRVCQEIF